MDTCTTTKVGRRLDEALADGFPAGDPPTLTEPAGDARDAAGCCCSEPKAKPAAAETPRKGGCCGGGR